jgi:hypothetical protein
MKRIVLCFDGTWNKPADEALPAADQVETNVRRFYRSLAPAGADGTMQVGVDHCCVPFPSPNRQRPRPAPKSAAYFGSVLARS